MLEFCFEKRDSFSGTRRFARNAIVSRNKTVFWVRDSTEWHWKIDIVNKQIYCFENSFSESLFIWGTRRFLITRRLFRNETIFKERYGPSQAIYIDLIHSCYTDCAKSTFLGNIYCPNSFYIVLFYIILFCIILFYIILFYILYYTNRKRKNRNFRRF